MFNKAEKSSLCTFNQISVCNTCRSISTPTLISRVCVCACHHQRSQTQDSKVIQPIPDINVDKERFMFAKNHSWMLQCGTYQKYAKSRL